MPVPVAVGVEIPDNEVTLSFIRSSGPGGQNVNKVATAVQLRFDLERSAVLDPAVKARLRALGGRRVTADGALLITARSHRSQEQNRREAYQRLADLVARALIAPRTRRPTAPTRAARARRLESKSRRRRTKQLRARPGRDD